MKQRTRRTTAATTTALLLLIAAAATGYYSAQALTSGASLADLSPVQSLLAESTWSSPVARIAIAATGLVGLVLLLAAVMPGKRAVLPASVGGDHCDVGVTRKGIERALRNAVLDVDGIESSRVRLGRRTARVRAQSFATVDSQMTDEATAAARLRLEQCALRKAHRVRCTVKEGARS